MERSRQRTRSWAQAVVCATIAIGSLLQARPSLAADQIYFPAVDNVSDLLVQRINAETVRIDMSCWYLDDDNVASALLSRFRAGVQVRLIGDRGSIFEIDQTTKYEFERLAAAGVPIRLRYYPTWYPEIDHWKATIFKGQGLVAFGSANYTPYELAPFSPTNYDDETVLFTTDTTLLGAFLTKFDQYWNDTTFEPESQNGAPPYFANWDVACSKEPACADYHQNYPNPVPMVISTARLEPNNPIPADLIFGQGPDFNNRIVQEINNESAAIDFVIYRLSVPEITNALLAKFAAGVPIRLITDPQEYTNRAWPEFWLTRANEDKMWAAGIPIKQRQHEGLTHMKTLITSKYATNASSNFTEAWQRDNDYFVSASTKPSIYTAIKNRFQTMWTRTSDFVNFKPLAADAPTLASPSNGATAVGQKPTLTWNTAAFATNYDVYLGTSPGAMAIVGNVLAQLVNNPPATYSWTASSALQGGTPYYWKIVSRTNATPRDPSIVSPSDIASFTTSGGGGGTVPAAPTSPVPANGSTGAATSGATLSWTSTGATSYDVKFGTANPPPQVSTGQAASSYTTGALAASTKYFWQIVAHNSAGATTGSVWSFTTGTGGGGGGSLPSPWVSQDVGATGLAGSASASGGVFTVKGAGQNVWTPPDSFQYVNQAVSGDLTLVARITSFQNAATFGKAGLMLRGSLAADAANVILDIRPTGDFEFMTRSTAGASEAFIATANLPLPAWVRLVRSGTTVTASVSSNGTSWTSLGSTPFSVTGGLAGLVVCSASGTLATTTFDNVSVAAGGGSGGSGGSGGGTASNIVVYANDITALHGSWAKANDASSPGGVKLVTSAAGVSNTAGPLAAPTDYVDVSFTAQANTPYTIWLRLEALNNDKFNDSVFVQFSDATAGGAAAYPMNSTAGLLVNLATDSTGHSLNGWGWENAAYWLAQATTVSFPTTGTHTLRVQVREDGVQLDQIVLSPGTYLAAAPGPASNDSTIVAKP